jgi:hypothetical protein
MIAIRMIAFVSRAAPIRHASVARSASSNAAPSV